MKPAAFLDRDGVICEYVDYLHKIEDFKLRPHVGDAIRTLNEKGYWVFIITNQPMVAKGLLTLEGLEQIHDRMKTDLAAHGAHIDAIEFCPHSTHGSVAPWNVECHCRKPQTGMIQKHCSNFAVDLKNSFLVGDTWRDIQCAQKMNLLSYGITSGAGFPYSKESPHYGVKVHHFVTSLWEAVQHQLSMKT